MFSRLKISLALLAGCAGLAIAGANLPIDTQLIIRTKLGKRIYPHWLVQPDSRVLKTEGGSGLIRLVGGLLGCAGFGAAMHLAGSDEREQRLFWVRQTAIDSISQKEGEVTAEINAGVKLKKLQMEAQAEIDFYSLQIQRKFREAIGFVPSASPQNLPLLPHGKPGSLDEITDPSDKIDNNNPTAKPLINESTDPLLRALLNSQISSLLFAGFLKLIGTPGSGKTTLTSALIRCRISRGHRLIVVNPHKRKSMYQEIQEFLVSGTTIYGVGLGDDQRAKSLIEGLNRILNILSNRYDEYQNKNEESYQHFPITLLLEEIGEWESLLALVMPLSEVEAFLQLFWRKLFIAGRKGRLFSLVTAQVDTQAMFKAKGLSGLFKESGAVTLRLTAVADSSSEDGWKPSGQGELKSPGCPSIAVAIPDSRSLINDVDYFGDCEVNTKLVATDTGGVATPDSGVATPPHTTTSHHLTPLLSKAFDSSHLSHHPVPQGWKYADPRSELTAGVKGVIVACIRAGWGQGRTIQEVFGIAKGGNNPGYELAKSLYQSVAEKLN